jgi:hypothetical protein
MRWGVEWGVVAEKSGSGGGHGEAEGKQEEMRWRWMQQLAHVAGWKRYRRREGGETVIWGLGGEPSVGEGCNGLMHVEAKRAIRNT